MIDFGYFKAVSIVGVILIVLSLLPVKIAGPEAWLDEWTVWLASYIGIGVTARGLWIISDAIAKRIARK